MKRWSADGPPKDLLGRRCEARDAEGLGEFRCVRRWDHPGEHASPRVDTERGTTMWRWWE